MHHVLRTVMVGVIVAAVLVAGVSTAVTQALTRPVPLSTTGKAAALSEELEFTIAERETVATVAMRLRAKGLLHTTLLFRFVVALQGAQDGFHPGTYRLRQTMSVYELVRTLQAGPDTAKHEDTPDRDPGPP